MAKKKSEQKINTGPFIDQQLQPAASKLFTDRIPHAAIIAVITIITWLCLKSSLDNQFTDWDDKGYILDNELIKSISFQGLKHIFSTPVMGNYHPLTILAYAIEYSFAAFEPFLYHFDSLVCHVLVTLLAYWLAYQLGHSKVAALVTALLFGVHPMHVESVVWVAGRKDVLCALFYFGACIAYLYFIRSGGHKRLLYITAIGLFVCALLCKPSAVTLPLALLLIDYYEDGAWPKSALYNKIPFFILALLFGAVSISIQHGGGAMDIHKESYGAWQKICLAAYALITYLWKAIAPAGLHCFYPYPVRTNGALPFIYNSCPVLIAAITLLAWKYARNSRALIFGLLFFTANIVLLLQLIPVGDAIVAERYTYIPYFGLFFIAGNYAALAVRKNRQMSYMVAAVCCGYIACLAYLSNERCKVWHDSYTLWTDEIKSEPVHAPLAYNNIGFFFFENGLRATGQEKKKSDDDSAVQYLSKAIILKPDFVNAYEGLGILYSSGGPADSSAKYFRAFIQLNPCSNAYYDYGTVLYATGKKDSAIIAYSKAIALDANNSLPYLNRGIINKERDRWDSAAHDLEKAEALAPAMGIAYYYHSFCDTQKKNNALALQEVEKAISLGFGGVDTGYYRMLKSR